MSDFLVDLFFTPANKFPFSDFAKSIFKYLDTVESGYGHVVHDCIIEILVDQESQSNSDKAMVKWCHCAMTMKYRNIPKWGWCNNEMTTEALANCRGMINALSCHPWYTIAPSYSDHHTVDSFVNVFLSMRRFYLVHSFPPGKLKAWWII